MLLRSDGQVVACGYLRYDLPPVEDGLPYVQVSAGWNQWPLLLRSDGKVIMYPSDKTEDGVTYVQAGGPFGVGRCGSNGGGSPHNDLSLVTGIS